MEEIECPDLVLTIGLCRYQSGGYGTGVELLLTWYWFQYGTSTVVLVPSMSMIRVHGSVMTTVLLECLTNKRH